MKIGKFNFKDCCWECGIKRYPQKRDMGSIGVAMKTCPICKKPNVGVVPARDWAYVAGLFEKYI